MSARRFIKVPGRVRYADVAATLALVIAVSGGTAYAVVTTVPPDSVNTAAIQVKAVTQPKLATEAVSADKIEPAAVTHGKLAANAVTGGDVLNHSLTLADLAGSTLAGPISFSLAAHGCGYLVLNVPGAKVGQRNALRVDQPGAYLVRVETLQTNSDHEHFSAIDLVIEGR